MTLVLSDRQRYTFRANLRHTRYGWLRLTPAYSLHLVHEQLAQRARPDLPVLDPFSGTGTTLLACAQQGVACDAVEINPFLVWLARAKAAAYPARSIQSAERAIAAMARAATGQRPRQPWLPAIHRIERWWSEPVQLALGRAYARLGREKLDPRARDLCRLAFCRALIDTAHVSFGHQSMSFKAATEHAEARHVAELLRAAFADIAEAAATAPKRAPRRVVSGDARQLGALLDGKRYGSVITSPPYVNRMSYIRELRPYMYWLGYLADKSQAGELDWRAIGGTWGSATSNLNSWRPNARQRVRHAELGQIVARISGHSELLGRYVERYFQDMLAHARGLHGLVARGGELSYVVGNSKFYDVVLPAEQVLAAIFEQAGFAHTRVETLRKRTSKRELFEYLVSARR